MLVLSRQRDETIMIGDDIEVTVVDIRGDKVRLGINAPKEISVHRKEVYDAIRRENRAAAQVKPEDLSGLGKITPEAATGRTAAAAGRREEVAVDCDRGFGLRTSTRPSAIAIRNPKSAIAKARRLRPQDRGLPNRAH